MEVIKSLANKDTNFYWQWGILVFLIFLMSLVGGLSLWYSQKYSLYTETTNSIKLLREIRNHEVGSIVPRDLPAVCNNLTRAIPWKSIDPAKYALVNWRPLTVRLVGYLGGPDAKEPLMNGVFDVPSGIAYALKLGARSFFFDIDYLEATPCNPLLLYRDKSGYKRSLNSGSILEATTALSTGAFASNVDPVLIIIYLRRIPPGKNQQSTFFLNLAQSLKPLAQHHLGLTDQGNFHNCGHESALFLAPITDYANKFIVCVNYDTFQPETSSSTIPTDNLHFWNNARIYQDPLAGGSILGKVTPSAPSSGVASIQVGSLDLILSQAPSTYTTSTTSAKFTISIAEPEYVYTNTKMERLLNTLGVQCVPIDVLGLGINPNHAAANSTISADKKQSPSNVVDLSNDVTTSQTDPLAYWYYAGWSFKNIEEPTAGGTPGGTLVTTSTDGSPSLTMGT